MDRYRNILTHFLTTHQKYVAATLLVLLFSVSSIFLFSKLFSKSQYSIALAGVPQSAIPKGDDFYSIRTLLSQIAPITYINITSNKSLKIDPHISLLIFIDNNIPVSNEQKKELKKFLNKGGSIIFMIDGIYIPSGGKPRTSGHNLFDFFTTYGIELQNNLVVSESSEVASISTGKTAFASTYPLWVKTTNFNKLSTEFAAISNLVFPWSSSVDIIKGFESRAEILVRSEKNSWVQRNQFNLAPNEVPTVSANLHQAYGLIAHAKTKTKGQLIVISSSRFVREQFLSTPPENTTFVANIAKTYFMESSHNLQFSQNILSIAIIVVGGVILTFIVVVIWRRIKNRRLIS